MPADPLQCYIYARGLGRVAEKVSEREYETFKYRLAADPETVLAEVAAAREYAMAVEQGLRPLAPSPTEASSHKLDVEAAAEASRRVAAGIQKEKADKAAWREQARVNAERAAARPQTDEYERQAAQAAHVAAVEAERATRDEPKRGRKAA